MRYICGWRNSIVMVRDTTNLTVVAYTLEDAIKASKQEKILGITDEGISVEDFKTDATSKAVVFNSDELLAYYLDITIFGVDTSDWYVRLAYRRFGNEKLLASILSRIELCCNEFRSYSNLVEFATLDAHAIALLDIRLLKDKYTVSKLISDKVNQIITE